MCRETFVLLNLFLQTFKDICEYNLTWYDSNSTKFDFMDNRLSDNDIEKYTRETLNYLLDYGFINDNEQKILNFVLSTKIFDEDEIIDLFNQIKLE